MNRGKEWWIKEIAALIALAVVWVLYLLHAATIAEVERLLQLGWLSLTLPFLTKELAGFLLRIRLAPPVNSPNVKVRGAEPRFSAERPT